MRYLLFLCMVFSLHASDDMIVSLEEHSSQDDDIVELILSDIFRENGQKVRHKIHHVMLHRLRDEPEEVRLTLLKNYREKPSPIYSGNLKEEVSIKVLDLLAESIGDVLDDEERKSEEWQHEAEGRCKKLTTAMISVIVGLGGAAAGGAIGAAVAASLGC